MRTTGAVAAVLALALFGAGCTKGGSDSVAASPGPAASPGAPSRFSSPASRFRSATKASSGAA